MSTEICGWPGRTTGGRDARPAPQSALYRDDKTCNGLIVFVRQISEARRDFIPGQSRSRHSLNVDYLESYVLQ